MSIARVLGLVVHLFFHRFGELLFLGFFLDALDPERLVDGLLCLENVLLERSISVQVVLLLVHHLQDGRVELAFLFKLAGPDAIDLLLRNTRPDVGCSVSNPADD